MIGIHKNFVGAGLSAGVLLKATLGRATYVLIRSVKTNKALLLARVTEPRRIRRDPLRRAVGEKLLEGDEAYGKNNIIRKGKRKPST